MEGDGLHFLEDLTPLSQALIQPAATPPSAYANLPTGSFVVINADICFKKFETRFLAGIGEANVSRTLDQIRETTVFRDLTSIVWDYSDTVPLDSRKRSFFFGKRTNLQIMWEYCYLSKVEMETSGEELDRSDIMIVEDFERVREFYNQEKTFKMCDDETMMDIFRFFVDRDIMLEATILAEKELAANTREEGEVKDNSEINVGNEDTEIIDTMVIEESEPYPRSQLSKAEKFYLECTLKNPKDIWNEFIVVDNSNFDLNKTNTLLNQKSKNYFVLEKRSGNTNKCFGLIFTEDTAFKNWLNRKPEDLGLISPTSFEDLENYEGASNLEVFRCLEKEAINYETNALHISAHMFFEKEEVKRDFNMILQDFTFKSGANKKVLKLCTTINKRIQNIKSADTSSLELGFVDKFVEVFRLRNKLERISADVMQDKWSQQWQFMWGYELYNRTVLYANPMFEKLFLPIMEERTKQDRIRGSTYMMKSLKAQINALMISMNNDYLTLMNITLFEEVIYKFLDPTSSQFVVVALVRAGMVYANKFLWESLIFKKLWAIAQEANWNKQKQNQEKRKLEQMQKPTSVQLDEKVEELVTERMDSTVPKEVRNILVGSIKSDAFKSSKFPKKYSKKANNKETQRGGEYGKRGRRWKSKNKDNATSATTPSSTVIADNTAEEKSAEMAPITITIPVSQQLANTAGTPQMVPPPFGSGNRGRGRGRFFGKGGKRDNTGSGRSFTKHSGEFDAYCMDVAPLNIFENQVVPMGLHNLSKIFKPNIATTRVFSLGMKFIPVWKKVVVKKPFCGFKEFRRRMTNKMFFERNTTRSF